MEWISSRLLVVSLEYVTKQRPYENMFSFVPESHLECRGPRNMKDSTRLQNELQILLIGKKESALIRQGGKKPCKQTKKKIEIGRYNK